MTIDPRIRRIGFAVFDAAMLEDWAVRNARNLMPPDRVKRLLIPALIGMLDRFEPEVLLVPDIRAGKVRRSKHVREMIRAVSREARKRGIVVHSITDTKVRKAFRVLNGHGPNQLKINHLLVEWFPELRPSMPKARKLWESERYFTPLFHAVAMYCAWQGVPEVASSR